MSTQTQTKPKSKLGRPRGPESEKKVPVTISALPSDEARWQARADADNRPLSQWLYLRLLAADARDEEMATRFTRSPAAPEI